MKILKIANHQVKTAYLLLVSAFYLFAIVGCANRPINPPINQIELHKGYRFLNPDRLQNGKMPETLVILAFSGGGTRAAAFSYGVLEALRDIELVESSGKKVRAIDQVNFITGVSGGSFTALSYALHGEKLFNFYEKDFLKRDAQGELIARAVNPLNWTHLASTGWGRSEMAAELYDEILFYGATYGDLLKRNTPFALASGTDISSGAGFAFNQDFF